MAAAVAGLAILAIALGWPRVLDRVRTFNEARDIRSRMVDRIDADLRVVRAELDTASIAVPQRDALRARLAAAAGRIASLPRLDPALVTTVLPLNATHAAVLAVHGAWLADAGHGQPFRPRRAGHS